MFEGKHIHFSPTDNKPLCSYSGKLCRQRRLNGYAFCIRHILEDKSAPFKQCSYVTRNNSQKCLNAIPTNQDRVYCHSHCQVVGMIPKTERKSKLSVNKADSISSNSSDKSSSPISKKDPGAVFKFEEDSSDTTDVFSYKNGLSNATNGKGKGLKGKETSSIKDNKKGCKSQNGFTATTFTTKKVTDKNRNVYTAIIPTGNGVGNNGKAKSNKNGSWNSSVDTCPTLAQQRSSSKVVHSDSDFRTQKYETIRGKGRELNKLHDVEELRQFEHLKTLKHLDRSVIGGNGSISSSDEESSCDAKFKIFPRLAAAAAAPSPPLSNDSGTIPETDSSGKSLEASDSTSAVKSSSSEESRCKSEIVSTPPVPPLITRSNNSIIIKTEAQQKDGGKGDSNKSESSPGEQKLSVSSNCRGKASEDDNNNNKSNSIDSRDLINRHDFLAHVRSSFKSQYTSIRKACKISDKFEEERKEKFRNSLIRCIKIDSSICAQVLVGNGSRCTTLSLEETKRSSCAEYDDYEFCENILSSSVVSKACTAIVDQHSKSKKFYSNGKKNSGEKKVKEEGKKNEKGKAPPKRSTSNGKKGQGPTVVVEANKNAQTGIIIPITIQKNNKRGDKKVAPALDGKILIQTPPSKRRLKRADAVGTSEDSSPAMLDIKIKAEAIDKIGKRRRFCSSDMASELGLSLNGQPSPGLSTFELGEHANNSPSTETGLIIKVEKDERGHHSGSMNGVHHHELHDILGHSSSSHRNQGLETVLNSVGSSENAGTPDGVITDASFDSTFEHSTSSQPECEFSEDDLEHSFELQIDPEIESQASRLLEDNVLTEADFTELFPDNRMSDHKFGRNELQELGMAALDFDVNDIDYSLFANIFPNFPRTSQPESISISNPF